MRLGRKTRIALMLLWNGGVMLGWGRLSVNVIPQVWEIGFLEGLATTSAYALVFLFLIDSMWDSLKWHLRWEE